MIRTATLKQNRMAILSSFVSATRSADDSPREQLDATLLNRGTLEELVLLPPLMELRGLRHLGPNWDGCGSAKPQLAAIANAATLLRDFYQLATQSGYEWMPPHVSATEDGRVSFEWWCGAHKLSVYFDDATAHFIKVWGVDIDNEMADGAITGTGFLGLWRWLNAG